MTTTIALAGKGGVGKTTIAALIIKYLVQTQEGAVLAIDADPSSNLNLALGLDLDWTVGDIREDMLDQVKESLLQGGAAMGTLAGGMSKRDYLDLQVRRSLSEGQDVDLIAMGRSEGPGCYCAVNHNLREVVDAISKNYRYVVIDNEAGLEHLSRRTTRDLEHLIVVSDPSRRGLVAAERIAGFSRDLDIRIENSYLVINRLVGKLPDSLGAFIEPVGLPLLGTVPAEPELGALELRGEPVTALGEDSEVYRTVGEMMKKALGNLVPQV
jgi:CO dehydrogenase maturation factor